MLEISKYYEEAQKELFQKFGAFFTFSEEETKNNVSKIRNKFNLGRKEIAFEQVYPDSKVLLVLAENKKALLAELQKLEAKANREVIEEIGIEKCILSELQNYECFYNQEFLPDVVKKLESFAISKAEVMKIYWEEWHRINANF